MDRVLVIIPAFNEEGSIGKVLREVKACLPEADTLVINDGSTDRTSVEARQAGAMVLDLASNIGLGGAIQTGFMFAKVRDYGIVVRMDGDGQHRPSELKDLIAPVERGEADVVIGSRFLQEEKLPISPELNGYEPGLTRRMGISLFSSILSLFLGSQVTDPTSGLQAMSRKAVDFFVKEYPPDYPEIEARILAYKARLNVKEIPCRVLKRMEGRSSITFFTGIYIILEALTSSLVGMLRKIER
jgi:glycosyltransferase involved in cell wall biosynthesis